MSSEGDDILTHFFLKLFKHWVQVLEHWEPLIEDPEIRESIVKLRLELERTISDIEFKVKGIKAYACRF